jgi:phosphoribosylamine---glycine ligase
VKVLVVGSGGREHALAWSLARSERLTELHAAPGNPGIASLASCHPVRAEDVASLGPLAGELGIDLVVVGPEAPLVAGLADELRHRGIAVFGPGADAARIEGSKAFSKDVMDAAGVQTARSLAVARPPCVVKADGLAAGKGVWVCHTQAELDAGLRAAEALGQPFHVEELLEGEEVSVFALCAGARATSASAMVTKARTRAAWARTRRYRDSRTQRSTSSPAQSAHPSSRSSRGEARRSRACCSPA